ncbi:MAG: TIGR01777 family oxidoreductase [Chlamydiales bacterium]
MKIIIAGSNGFIGSRLAAAFNKEGVELVLLSRHPRQGEVFWNPEAKEVDRSIFLGADIVINLTGERIVGRWNQKKKLRISQSRFCATQFLCDLLLELDSLPHLYFNASAIGFYGDRKKEVLKESSSPGRDFLAEVCLEWEKIPNILVKKGVRVILMRFGMVLGENGGILKLIKKPFSIGIGGVFGQGDQMMSWIAIDDLIAAIQFIIQHKEISGPVNFSSPYAVSNLEFTKILASLFGKSKLLKIPRWILSMIFGDGSDMFMSSIHAYPDCLLKYGFYFQYPDIEPCLKKYLRLND